MLIFSRLEAQHSTLISKEGFSFSLNR